jgi:hypothetical protein
MDAERNLPAMLEGAATPILSAVGDLLSGVAAAITIMFLVIFMLIFGGRLITAAVAEAAPSAARCTRTCSPRSTDPSAATWAGWP